MPVPVHMIAMHWPPLHICEGAHALPHVPQLCGSLAVVVQVPPHETMGAVQVHVPVQGASVMPPRSGTAIKPESSLGAPTWQPTPAAPAISSASAPRKKPPSRFPSVECIAAPFVFASLYRCTSTALTHLATTASIGQAGRMHAPHTETHRSHVGGWLRAAVLGANDGVVSTAALVLGVAQASGSSAAVTAGLAGLVGGSLAMAAGEYVSVSSQRDVEQADLAKERRELATQPELEKKELVAIYVRKGLDEPLARQVAEALSAQEDVLRVHAREELGIDPDELARPGQAALVSAAAFGLGASLPLASIAVVPTPLRTLVTLGASLLALALLGGWSARLGHAPVRPAVARVLIGGIFAMGVTMLVGHLVG
jgi:VIT1/CCC1 family predicted Fe2+/Mn2+ transporter